MKHFILPAIQLVALIFQLVIYYRSKRLLARTRKRYQELEQRAKEWEVETINYSEN
jgi:hypothetical protein